ncbi:DNA-formamidopyrimidine glycosylase [Bacillus carboniphilus]|uniref:Formamidopyrimidine-DNA glycosylase n=1 Tax=Bacillus carboniphilus TaxID=86663 RepID=A0ABY9JXQ3_9BACI|nr:DNA-formamidopyrimidine glycosylase [Bacillus carboniphilus]WLR44156.1 DNA-formamidopyrimidine glycosylase [Bacillus carboniphilus]
MPELPEVETVRRTLHNLIISKQIESVTIQWPKIIKHPDDALEFETLLKGQKIHQVDRRGKFLKIFLDDFVLVSHLRMEGRFGVYTHTEEIDKHTHVIFHFTDGKELRYRDVRKFGTMHLFPKGEEEKQLPLSQLGPEPFSKDFTFEDLKMKLSKTKRFIKVALLDQRFVVGLGNIYVDEALFLSGVHPERISNELGDEEIERLHHYIIQTLKKAVDKGGSTIRSYVNSQGEIGMFQNDLYVYGREEQPCKQCQTPIKKIKVGGRGTHFCEDCQK